MFKDVGVDVEVNEPLFDPKYASLSASNGSPAWLCTAGLERMAKELKKALSKPQWQEFTKKYSNSIKRETQSIRRFNALKNKTLINEKEFSWLETDVILGVKDI